MVIKAVTVLLAASIIGAPAIAGVNGRQDHQRQRITQGWKSGELTRGESLRLGRQQHHIAHAEARMRADGGSLNRIERARLHGMQDRASVNIHRKKHNDKSR